MAINFTHIPRTFESAIEMTPSDIFPVVLIGSVSRVEDNPGYHNRDKFIFLSTKSVSLKNTGSVLADSNDKPVQFDPYLLNIPSIRESIDIKDHSYKVGSVKLDISNHLIDLENTMSDKFYQEGFFGQKVRLYFATKSTEYFAFNPYKISDADEYDKSAYLVFVGTISGVTHDKSKLTITLDDATQNKFDTMLPKKIVKRIDNVNFNEQITKDIGKFYPMCYGDVDYAPTVITQDPNSSRRIILQADSEQLEGTASKTDPLFIYKEDYVRVPKERNQFKENYWKTQYEFDLDESRKDVINFDKSFESGNPVNSQATNKFEVVATRTPRSVTYSNNKSNEPGITTDDGDSGFWTNPTFTNHGNDEVGNTAITNFNTDLNATLQEKDFEGITYNLNFNTGNPFLDVYNIIGSRSFINHPYSGASMKAIGPYDSHLPSMTYLFYGQGDDSSVNYVEPSNAEILEEHKIFRDQKDVQITLSEIDVSNDECVRSDEDDPANCRHKIFIKTYTRLRIYNNAHNDGSIQYNMPGENESKMEVRLIASRGNPQESISDDGGNNNAPTTRLLETSTLGNIADYHNNPTSSNESSATNDFGGPYNFSLGTADGILSDVSIPTGIDEKGKVTQPSDLQDITLSLRFVGDDRHWFRTTTKWDIYNFYINQYFEINNFYIQDMYIMTRGRQVSQELHDAIDDESVTPQSNVGSSYLQSAHSIISDIVTRDLGFDGQIDTDSYKLAAQDRPNRFLAFSIKEEIESKELIKEISKTSKLYPRFKSNGMFTFETIIHHPLKSHYDNARVIQNADCIKYSYSKTPLSDIATRVKIRYHKDYAKDELVSETDWYNPEDYLTNWNQEFYGMKDSKDSELIFETEYLRDRVYSCEPEIVKLPQTDLLQTGDNAVDELAQFLTKWNCNQHIIIKVVLPVNFMTIEVGDLVRFKDLLGGVKAFGVDYTTLGEINGQNTYPLFFVTSTKKSINNIELECVQHHNISGSVDNFYANLNPDTPIYNDPSQEIVYGCTNTFATNYNPDATIDDGTCTFADTVDYDETAPTPMLTESVSLYGNSPVILNDVNTAINLTPNYNIYTFGSFDNLSCFFINFSSASLVENPSGWDGQLSNLPESFFIENDSSWFISLKHSVDSGGEVEIGPDVFTDIESSGIDFSQINTLEIEATRLGLPEQYTSNGNVHFNYNSTTIQTFNTPLSGLDGNWLEFTGDDYSTFKLNLHEFWEEVNPTTYPEIQEYWEYKLGGFIGVGQEPKTYVDILLKLTDMQGNSIRFVIVCQIPFPPYNGFVENYVGDYGPLQSNLLGDVNFDGGINILDVVALLNYVLTDEIYPPAIPFTDVNQDGGVNILDVVQLINFVLETGADYDD